MKVALALSMSLFAAAVATQARTPAASGAASVARLANPQSGASRPPAPAGAGEGLAILNRSCTSCHDKSQATRTRPSAEWQPVLERMRDNGANISDADAKTLLAYLIKNYSSRN